MGNDGIQPREVTNQYFADAEQLKDFIDYLFDIEKVGDYNEMWKRFERYEENLNEPIKEEKPTCKHNYYTFFSKGYRKCLRCGDEYPIS